MSSRVLTEQFGLNQQTLGSIRRCLATFPAIEQVILYGSRAMGTYRPGSDIDLVIYGDQFSHHDLLNLLAALDELFVPYSFDVCRRQDIKHADLLSHIDRVGQLFYQRQQAGNGFEPALR